MEVSIIVYASISYSYSFMRVREKRKPFLFSFYCNSNTGDITVAKGHKKPIGHVHTASARFLKPCSSTTRVIPCKDTTLNLICYSCLTYSIFPVFPGFFYSFRFLYFCWWANWLCTTQASFSIKLAFHWYISLQIGPKKSKSNLGFFSSSPDLVLLSLYFTPNQETLLSVTIPQL